MADERELLREHAARVLRTDTSLADQIATLRGMAASPEMKETVARVRARVATEEGIGGDPNLGLETIVSRVGRPVLEVANDDYLVEGPEATVWQPRLGNDAVRAALRQVIPAVGRVEVDRHPDLSWVGTGWLIADDVLVTNRHVAAEFAVASGQRFVFKRGWPDRSTRMAARVDFRRELHDDTPRAFAVKDVLHIEDDDGADFAFLKVERGGAGGGLSQSLRSATDPAAALQYVATVGYPAADSRIPEQGLMDHLFGDKYNVKRLAPGQVLRLSGGLVLHDCTTLGGNSGSPIVDLATGQVVGLHFSGVFLRENRGVPIGEVVSRLARVRSAGRPTPPDDERLPQAPTPATAAPPPVGAAVSFTIPLHVSVTLGVPTPSVQSAVGTSPAPAPTPTPAITPSAAPAPRTGSVAEAVVKARARLAGRDDVLTVRDGFVFRNGWITSEPAVVVVLKGRAGGSPADFPAQVLGVPVEVRPASPWDVAAQGGRSDSLEGLTRTSYKKPADFKLTEVHEEMTVTVHVSPDAGWPTLREFLKGTKKGLTVGMYDFTAPHIVDGVLAAVKDDPKKLTLVLQEKAAMGGKPNDIPEEKTLKKYRRELGDRFDHAPASVGKDHQFASAYHIKVAVRDGKAFWLSSGNWQSSNQPDHEVAAGEGSWDLLTDHNREWHAVIENPTLAKQFEKYLLYDLKNAKEDAGEEAVAPADALFVVDAAVEERVPAGRPTYFPPLTVSRKVKVRPLLTPDNYHEHVLALIESAERRVLFQNQSLNLLGTDENGDDKNDPRFVALADALLDKQKAGVDVRVIMRGEFAPVGPLEQLQRRGFDMGKVRLQNRCHTKGIIVDGERVLIGSHNWTNQGTLVNRDASLIFDDAQIAGYFEEVFWFDWKHLSRQSVGGRRPRAAGGEEAVGRGERLVSWREIVNGD